MDEDTETAPRRLAPRQLELAIDAFMAPRAHGLSEFEVLVCLGTNGPFLAAKAPPWALREPATARAVAARIGAAAGGLPVLLVWRRDGERDVRSFGERSLARDVARVDVDSARWRRLSLDAAA